MQLHPSYILHLTFASVGAAYCLQGYWLAFGKQPWMWRAGAVCAALALLVPIRAYEPLVFFALTSLLFVAAAGCQKVVNSWLERRRPGTREISSTGLPTPKPRFQFRLHDLLGLMAVIGAGSWMVRIILREEVLMPWGATFISVGVAVAITGTTIGLLRGPRRIVSGVVLLVVVGLSVGFFYWNSGVPATQYVVIGELGEWLFSRLPLGGGNDFAAQGMFILLVTFIVFLALFSSAARALHSQEAERTRRKMWRAFGTAPYLAWALPMGWLYLQLLSYPHPPAQTRDRPNSLPLILERGQSLESLSGTRARKVSAEVIKLSKEPGFVHIPWEADLKGRRNYEDTYMNKDMIARSICRSLDAQAKALEKSEPELAADHVLAIIRIGQMLQHEGLKIDSLVGMALEGLGSSHLIRLRRQLSQSKAGEVVAELEKAERSRDHGEIERDEAWDSLNKRWAFRLDQVLISGPGGDVSPTYHPVYDRDLSRMRLLMIDLALRDYRLDHGKYPPHLGSLVPQYLTEVPLDPFCEKPFIYRPAEPDFVLYGVGGDGVDNGGVFGPPQYYPNQWEGYDLNLDAPWE